MQIHISARHLRLTEPIRAYVESKVRKAEKYVHQIVWAQAVLSVEKLTHEAEIVLHAPQQTFRALAKAVDLYAAIDLASDKIDAQLKKYKDRRREHHGRFGPGVEEPVDIAGPLRVSVIKQVPLRPMTREDAANEMDRLGFNFWLFQDQDSRQIQVIYRRIDDSYGLLQPVKWNGK